MLFLLLSLLILQHRVHAHVNQTPLVFQIGFNKGGTQSLAMFFQKAGLSHIHG